MKKIWLAFTLLLLVLLGAFLLLRTERRVALQTVRLADVPVLASAMVYVAEERGYFAGEGIAVVYSPRASGKEALEAALGGEADLALMAETPLVFALLAGQPASILATISETDTFVQLMADRGAGIAAPADLRGKRIATPRGSNAEFYLAVYLLLHGIAESEVEIVDLPPGEAAAALLAGKVAAVSIWQPHLAAIEEGLGERKVLFFDPIYRMTMNLAAGEEWAAGHQETILGVLRALKRAEEFMAEHPRAALRLVQGRLGDSSGGLGERWGDYRFDLKLGQALLLSMEDQARWAMKRQDAPGRSMPDFLEAMDVRGMRMVDPRSATVIHP
jgi:NitT/TauT family transport system substrate-binding protein